MLSSATRSCLVAGRRRSPVQKVCRAYLSTNSHSVLPERRHAHAPPVALPPNLRIDPRSMFAPKTKNALQAILADSSNLEDMMDDGAEADDEDGVYTDAPAKEPGDEGYQVPPSKHSLDDIAENDAHMNLDNATEDDEQEQQQLYITPLSIQYAIPLPDRLKVPVHTLFHDSASPSLTGTLHLDATVFGHDPVRVDLLKRSVDYYRAKKRGMRTAKTKTISEVSGSGKKRRQQKGTGSARMGHSRPAHHRGGAKAHGPKNTRNYGNTKLNKKVRKLALAHALSQKLLEGNLVILDVMHPLPTHKTKELVWLLNRAGLANTKVLLLDHYDPEELKEEMDNNNDDAADDTVWATPHYDIPINLHVASGNLFKFNVGNSNRANVYDILWHQKLVLTVAALQKLEARLSDL